MRQVEIDFEPGLTRLYPEFIDAVRAAAYGCGRQLKAIAADMDLSSSELSRRLSENPNDPRHLAARELPALIEACGDRGRDIVYWLVEKFLEDEGARQDRALSVLREMAPQFLALMREALPESDDDRRQGGRNG